MNKQPITNNKEQDYFFDFEAEFIESLRCIPMVVRMKLDTCGVKLKLVHWNQFNQEEKQDLVEKPCAIAPEIDQYREFLQSLVEAKTGAKAGELTIEERPAWLDDTVVPIETQAKAAEFDVALTIEQWRSLTPLQRFALIKLSRPSHENSNFLPALREFKLI
jgi:hypothetical protein